MIAYIYQQSMTAAPCFVFKENTNKGFEHLYARLTFYLAIPLTSAYVPELTQAQT
jgi:hypothetical protein